MKKLGDLFRLSASDLAGHLGCHHLTALEVAVATGHLEKTRSYDPRLEALFERGLRHEQDYVETLRAQGLAVVEMPGSESPETGFERTCAAMRAGAAVITQPWLLMDPWYGRADVLRRVEVPSWLGGWSYEVLDMKLARDTRAGAVLQLSLYSEIVGSIQGLLPEAMSVVTPLQVERFRVLDYAAYYRFVKERLERAVSLHRENPVHFVTYPEPVPLCDTCGWWLSCDGKRHGDDHISLVAGISSLQRNELATRGVRTLEALATMTFPLIPPPRRGSADAYARVHHQARIQLQGRRTQKPQHELLDPLPGRGLALLPEPDPGDVFLDLEGDPFVADGGREYLFGWVAADPTGEPAYHSGWATSAEEEKAAFEALVDDLSDRWRRSPGLHVYHYAPYEPGALKRLMGRYATREDEIDRMLRAGLFVDLYSVVRQGVRASVEHYSIKDFEVFYGFKREIDLRDAGAHRRGIEIALELGRTEEITDESRKAVERYNCDDCLSARRLRGWLEERRAEAIGKGYVIARPVFDDGEPTEKLTEWLVKVRELAKHLTEGVPIDPAQRSAEEQARWILAQLLEFHRRELKAPWWEYFRLRELTPDELLEERSGLSGLRLVTRVKKPKGRKKRPTDRYSFPIQETAIREKSKLHDLEGASFGEVVTIDLRERTVDIIKTVAAADSHPEAVFAHSVVTNPEAEKSLFRLGEWIAKNSIDAAGPNQAARDLLLPRPPRVRGRTGGDLYAQGENIVAAARRLAIDLDHTVLPLQGPPGSGKTYTGARMICQLVRRGKRVGVSAVSHKVIRNLLEEVLRAAAEDGVPVACIQKPDEESENPVEGITEVFDNESILAALRSGQAQVGAGTAWLWSRPEYAGSVDTLFIDEAGQMSLANAIAVAQAGANLVLLGDPQQLEQPIQGSHPEGTSVSALEHILEGAKTVPRDRGIFLEETWRLHPKLCEFTSELFYENRLRSRPGLERQVLSGETLFAGAGLWFVPVDHSGNQNTSVEEVYVIAQIVEELTSGAITWTNQKGQPRKVTRDDILIVAPYNLQVHALEERLPGHRIGTVDRFQGQEAAVVIYSMTTSSPEEAPRGMEFLYSLSRLNVATSRARAACILVANPRLFEPDCRTPRQMQLANAFCRFLEMANVVARPLGNVARQSRRSSR